MSGQGDAREETPLLPLLRRRIASSGAIPLSEYMALCLAHPEHGYYTTREPLGAAGDFTTAPEISQMFGELLGLWIAQAWLDMGAPKGVVLAELGPGRGTLMADALRAASRAPGFAEAVSPWLVEISPTLRARQATALEGRGAAWVERVEDLPDAPLLLLANEFFDALPIRQLIRAGGRWRERAVSMDEAGRLRFGLGAVVPWGADEPDGAVVELCPAGEAVAAWIGARLAARGGAALIVDYGYAARTPGGADTFQAMRTHAYADPLAAPGRADLTAHVDFATLARRAGEAGATAWPTAGQGAFLERLGITQRAQALARAAAARPDPGPAPHPPALADPGPGRAAAEDPVEAIVSAHRRLTHPEEMGTLFKVLALTGPNQPRPAGV
ncbi:SAM-dependent methyltransferase [Albimonas sp. CAU 1670]|uniref:class I SAM-dependent methyltransferase n=1 Tax=Albimonas sp. CAU 1670 TaxID=3032599 RepID=UPI0023DBE903|nr:SAM-dependent methyltransferase [Albimonas sp. CAU 1670]MDF2234920.1 SAM-dependent methyltransferase [Albimonas sp. CAU 1670]